MVMRCSLALLVTAITGVVAGCSSVELAGPRVRARTGPAAARSFQRVVALPATCGSLATVAKPDGTGQGSVLVPSGCNADAVRAADTAVRASLEFFGARLIDSEQVNAVTATRREVIELERGQRHETAVTRGARFEDATPHQQAEILRELGADGVLTTRMWIGADAGTGQRRAIVQVRMMAVHDRALAWARRCELDMDVGIDTDADAIARAARCAAESEHGR